MYVCVRPVTVSHAVIEELKRIVKDSEITKCVVVGDGGRARCGLR